MTDAETKEVLKKGMDKGLELFNMGKKRFMALSQKGKLIACAAASIFLLMLVLVIIPGEDYADPYKFIEHELKLDMKERADFYEKNDIVGYEILRAEKEGRMVRGAVKFIPRKNAQYYWRKDSPVKDLDWGGFIIWTDPMGEECKKEVEEVKRLKDVWKYLKCYCYWARSKDSVEEKFVVGVEIERRFVDGKWRPRYNRNEIYHKTYFDIDLSYTYSRQMARETAKECDDGVVVFCDKDGNIESKKQRNFFEEYDKSVDRYFAICNRLDDLRRKKEGAWEKEYAKGVKELLNILSHIPIVPEA